MSQEGPGLIVRIRQWIAGVLFLTAGRLDPLYDVWVDTAEHRYRK